MGRLETPSESRGNAGSWTDTVPPTWGDPQAGRGWGWFSAGALRKLALFLRQGVGDRTASWVCRLGVCIGEEG